MQQFKKMGEKNHVLAELGILVSSSEERHKKSNSKEHKDLRSWKDKNQEK